jgi:glucosamine kinase
MSVNDILIGVDGGGTHSRAMCTDLDGNVLAYGEGAGTNPDYNSAAHTNFRQLVSNVLLSASRRPDDIVGLTAGLAGIDAPDDERWAIEMTSIPSMPCVPRCVNDAIVAQAGAFALRPGILVVASTGSITVGINERSRTIRNFDFNHYAPTSARFLSHEAIFRLLIDDLETEDQPFIDSILGYWKVNTLEELRDFAQQYTSLNRETMIRRYGEMAPLVTAAASDGGPLAMRVCDWAATAIADGVRLVRTFFESDETPVAIIGGVGRSAYMYAAIAKALRQRMRKRCVVVEPLLSPVCGAILLAARDVGLSNIDNIQSRLAQFHQR